MGFRFLSKVQSRMECIFYYDWEVQGLISSCDQVDKVLITQGFYS